MDYQDVVEQYKNNKLKSSDIRSKIKIARSLDFKNRYMFMNNEEGIFSEQELKKLEKANYIVQIQEAHSLLNDKLQNIYQDLMSYVSKTPTRDVVGKQSRIYDIEVFTELPCADKIKAILKINDDYSKYLEYIKIASAIDYLSSQENSAEDNKKVLFLLEMFKSIKGELVKPSIAFFEKSFFHHLINSQKKDGNSLDEYFEKQKENIQWQYKKAKALYSEEELIELCKIIVATSKNLEISVKNTIKCFSEISEVEFEQMHLAENAEDLKDFQKKYEDIQRKKEAEEKRILEEERKRQEEEKKRAEQEKRRLEEEKRKAEKANKSQKLIKNRNTIGYANFSSETTGKIEEKIIEHKSSKQPKEDRIVIVLYWMERSDNDLNKRVNKKTLNHFFETVKQIEKNTGKKTSMFLVTNANREITLNRVNQLEEQAQKNQLTDFVEGAIGGYGTFWIDEEKQIVDNATMTEQQKEIIKQVLEKNEGFKLRRDILDDDTEDYLRYKFPERVSKSLNEEYLILIKKLVTRNITPRIAGIKLIHFVENEYPGLDVVLNSQLEAFYLLPEYYKAKYNVGEIYKADIKNMDIPQPEKPGEEHE